MQKKEDILTSLSLLKVVLCKNIQLAPHLVSKKSLTLLEILKIEWGFHYEIGLILKVFSALGDENLIKINLVIYGSKIYFGGQMGDAKETK